MSSVKKAGGSVKRVVLTSSIVALNHYITDIPGGRYDASCWNTGSTAKTLPYPLSKTLAETVAWQLCKEQVSVSACRFFCGREDSWRHAMNWCYEPGLQSVCKCLRPR